MGGQRGVLAILVAAYLLLAWPVTFHQGVNWDEQTDLDIAAAYSASLGGLAYGTRIDAINTRLPMYSQGLLSRVLPLDDRLHLARWLSVLLGVLTLVVGYRTVSTWTDRPRALATCAIVATSPYFIYFSSMALSEGDIWITAATAGFLAAATWYLRAGATVERLAVLGGALGLSLSAKISGLALLPVALTVVAAPSVFVPLEARAPRDTNRPPPALAVPIVVAIVFVPWLLLTVAVSHIVPWPVGSWCPPLLRHPLTRWAVAALLLASLLAWSVRHRGAAVPRVAAGAILLLVAGLAFFVVPPVHTTNIYIVESLWRVLFVAGDGVAWDFVVETSALHVLVVLLKPGVGVGLAMLIGTALAIGRVRRRPELRLGLLVVGAYMAFLALLPWAQTRYMMPVFPLLAFFAADALVGTARRRPRIVAAFAIVAAGLLIRDFALTYPDLNLNGYQWVGPRYLAGRSTLGYRGIGTTPSDGVEQSLAWVCERAGLDDHVLTFIGEEHIFHATCPAPRFERIDGLREPFDLHAADYVVTSINTDVEPGQSTRNPRDDIFKYPYYDRAVLERDFARAYSVRRAFDIEVAAVWVAK